MLQYTARIESTDTPRVGGRNLIKKGDKERGTIGGYLIYYLHTPIDKAEPFTLSFDLLSVDRLPAKGEFLVLFMYNTRFQTSVYIKYEEGRVRYSCIIETLDREAYDKGFQANAVYIYPNESYYNPKNPDAGGFTIANVKLERGTVATDWTPAPEDVAESVTSLESKLLDPEQGEIHKLTDLLDKHKTATDKSFEDLATHPLTVDDNGFWKIWSVKDNKYVTTQYQSRGRDGQAGADGKDGHSPNIRWNGTQLLIDDLQAVDLRGQRGATGAKGDRGETGARGATGQTGAKGEKGDQGDKGDKGDKPVITLNDKFQLLADGVLLSQQSLKGAKGDRGETGARGATGQTGAKGDKGEPGHSPSTEEVLRTPHFAELLSDEVTTQIKPVAGKIDDLDKRSLTPQQLLDVSYLIGNIYFEGSQIAFRTSPTSDPYLSIGAEESEFIDNFINSARTNDTPVSVSSVSLTASNAGYQRTISVDNDGTRLTINIDKVNVAVYKPSTLRLTLDGVTIAEWQGKTKYTDVGGNTGGEGGGKGIKVDYVPYEASNLTYERVVRAGSHVVRLAVVNPTSGQTASVTGLRVRRRYDTGAQQSLLTKSGLRLFGSPDSYLDVDYRPTYRADLGNGRYYNLPNPYLLRIKGGAKVDKLTADELDVPGAPLCGASFDASGSQVKAFGKYAKRQGYNQAQAVYYDSGRFFRVYHSIGHTNYLPTVQVIGDNGNDINWNLTARIYAVNANDFAVRIITNGDNPIKHAFSFVAFKTM